MFKILIILFIFVLNSLYASNINSKSYQIINNLLLKEIKVRNLELYNETKRIMKEAEINKKSGDVVYCLISDSVPFEYMKNIVLEGSALNISYETKIVFVLQGYYSKSFLEKVEKLYKSIDKYQYSEYFKKNINILIDPIIFKDYGITKVPVFMYGEYQNSFYPDSRKIKYITRGNISMGQFFNLISTKDKDFEKYFYTISNLY